MVFLLFENLERASISILMLSAKPGNHWYHFLMSGMTWPLSGIEPWTSRTQSEHSTTMHIDLCLIFGLYDVWLHTSQ